MLGHGRVAEVIQLFIKGGAEEKAKNTGGGRHAEEGAGRGLRVLSIEGWVGGVSAGMLVVSVDTRAFHGTVVVGLASLTPCERTDCR